MIRYILDREYPRLLGAFGINTEEALRKAELPVDTFSRESPSMTAKGYFAFMQAIEDLAPQEDTAIRLSSAGGIEQFSPPVFAAYCARNGRACIERLARHKRLIGPMVLIITEQSGSVTVEFTCPKEDAAMPSFLVTCEFAFLTNLLRSATRTDVSPLSAHMQQPPSGNYLDAFLRCEVKQEPRNTLVFSTESLNRPFISRNDAMWEYFEPELKRRLSDLEVDDSFSARVRSALIEALPAGEAGIDDVARRLGTSKRTLQRKLGDEGTTFQKQLNHTRELLSKHYLSTTAMRTDEIAYLLGYLELNSFLRAFSSWTGQSPSEYRKACTL